LREERAEDKPSNVPDEHPQKSIMMMWKEKERQMTPPVPLPAKEKGGTATAVKEKGKAASPKGKGKAGSPFEKVRIASPDQKSLQLKTGKE
jgi:hypothetical protein